ncbi:MAG TPA: sigma-70 family RNA polymerase sigma factor [Usitatibacter sp.]|nr:sigma-70 family RNA polymerase sigma factor [Usitatibacter sp.]
MFGRSASHFDQVVRAYAAELFHFALWLARDRHRAEDILQEALTRAWRSWGHVKDEGARRAWLYAIVRNEFHREAGRAKRDEAEELDEEALARMADERDFTRGIEVRQILERLPAPFMEPLVLQNLAGLSCEEVAQVLGVSVGAAMTRISRARSALRDLLRKAEGRPAPNRKETMP